MARGFIPNPNFAKELTGERAYKEGLAAAAEPAAEAARAIAPVGTVIHETKAGYVNNPGDYKKSIKIVTDPRGIRYGRAAATRSGSGVYLTASDWKAWWIEFGTVDTPVFAPLRRGAVAAGFKLRGDKGDLSASVEL
jgi:hypothetical protein